MENMVDTKTRLQQLMSERGIRQVDILNASLPYQKQLGIKMSKSHLSQYVNGKSSPDQRKLYLLAKTLNVNEAWLMGYDIDKDRSSSNSEKKEQAPILSLINETASKLEENRQKVVLDTAQDQLDEQTKKQQSNVVSINEERKRKDPFSKHRKGEKRGVVGAGLGVNNYYEDISYEETHEWEQIPIPDDAPYDFDWLYIASGDSMEPEFKDNDIIYARRATLQDRQNLSPDEIYVVRVNGVSFLKKIRVTKNCLYLVSLNEKYPEIRISEDDDIKLIAIVVR